MKDRKAKYIALQNIFFNFDPMDIGVKENNLKDEYDAEISCLLETMVEEPIENAEDLKDCLTFIFEEMFGLEPDFEEEFLAEVAAVLEI